MKRIDIFNLLLKTGEKNNVRTTYSSVSRHLNKNEKSKLEEFRKVFKNAFDEAFIQGLDNAESFALMEAMQKINIKDINET